MKSAGIIGKRFGRLVVLNFHGKKPDGQHLYKCICDCGNNHVVMKGSLVNNKTLSCGCLRVQRNKEMNSTHGMWKTRVYGIWKGMIQRCNNPKTYVYKYYGGRGITVCKRWLKFENFYKDMSDPPKGMTLDRIDNNKGYIKSNCRWATMEEQCNNRRDNRKITFEGQTLGVSQWARKIGIRPMSLLSRLGVHSIEVALTAQKSVGSRRLK